MIGDRCSVGFKTDILLISCFRNNSKIGKRNGRSGESSLREAWFKQVHYDDNAVKKRWEKTAGLLESWTKGNCRSDENSDKTSKMEETETWEVVLVVLSC